MSDNKPRPTDIQIKKLPTGEFYLTWKIGGQEGFQMYRRKADVIKDINKTTIFREIRQFLAKEIVEGRLQ